MRVGVRGLVTALAVVLPGFALSNVARAETDVGDGTTPLATSTANAGAADNLVVTGTQTISSPGPAITIDSDNSVYLSGGVSMTNQDGGVGVRIYGGHTGSYTQTGSVNVLSSYTATDANGDGAVESPFAQGSNRIGLEVTGGAFNGAITTGSITVQGDNSYGVALNGNLIGDLTVGTTTVTGLNAIGLNVGQAVTGNVTMNGPLNVVGANSKGVVIAAPVNGRFSTYYAVTATGFGLTTRSTVATTLSTIQNTASEVELGGSAVSIASNITGGILIGAPPQGTAADSTADNDGDGSPDGTEGTSSIASYGSAPALSIGSITAPVTIGAFSPAPGTPNSNYDLMIRGNVSANGVYDGFSATAISIGGTGQTTTLTDGVRIVGDVSATAYSADATGLHLRSGGLLGGPTALWVDGSIVATIGAPVTGATSPISLLSNRTATGVLIDGGATAPTIVNNGVIIGTATGDNASAYGVRDLSGSVVSLVNRGTLSASITAATSGATPSGRAIALDVSASTHPFTFTQENNSDPVINLATGVSIGPASPSVTGDMLFGSGANTVKFLAGTVVGGIDLGGGAGSSITVDGGAVYLGALTNVGGNFALNVVNGSFLNSTVRSYDGLSALNVGSQGVLGIGVDPAGGQSTQYNVTGSAVFANGAGIGATVVSPLTGTASYTIVTATGGVSADPATMSLTTNTPLLYTASLANTGSALNFTIRRRTPTEIGVSTLEADGFDAVYTRSFASTALFTTLNGAATQADLVQRFRLALPEHGGAMLLTAMKGVDAAYYAGQDIEPDKRGAWAREYGFGLRTNGDDVPRAEVGGMGAALGFEGEQKWFGQLRLLGDFFTARQHSPALPDVDTFDLTVADFGLGWRAQVGEFQVGLTGKGGYANMSTRRTFQYWNADGTKGSTSELKGSSNGAFFSGIASASYLARFGAGLYLQPRVSASVYDLRQGGYTEEGDSTLALKVEDRDSRAAKAKGEIEFGAQFGDEIKFRPKLIVGYEDIFSDDSDLTTAAFSGESQFSLGNQDLKGGYGLARLGFTVEGANMGVDIEGGGASGSDGSNFDGMITLRARF